METIFFDSEFGAMGQCSKYLKGLKCELTIMGEPFNLHCFIFCDNKSVFILEYFCAWFFVKEENN